MLTEALLTLGILKLTSLIFTVVSRRLASWLIKNIYGCKIDDAVLGLC